MLTAAQVDGIFEFAEALDYDVMFTIGAGKGVRDEDKAWTPDMARALLGEFYHELSFGGVSSAYWPSLDEVTKVYPDFLQMGGANLIDVITWHYYPQQSERGGSVVSDPWERGLLLDPERLDIVFDWADEIVDYRDADAPGTPIWFGETGHAQYGGQRIRDQTIGHRSYGVG